MNILYRTGLLLYSFAVRIAAMLGNEKARFFHDGRINILKHIEDQLLPGEKRIWFHVASLGEFEQGRPIMEKIKASNPEIKIFLTFFSPSGYEIRKNYSGADYIFYLPMDSPSNARKFIDMVNPTVVFFIKYEFWYYYITLLHKRNIPIYLCSANFRSNQAFFQWYGGWYRSMLFCFKHLFVQSQKSEELLHQIGINNVTITGDTRFDRVYSIASSAREIKEVEIFTQGKTCLIAGSTWVPDDELICNYLNETTLVAKAIIAPHEIGQAHLEKIEQLLTRSNIRFSQWKDNLSGDYDVLIIDNIGMLSSLYRYGQVAYIGGGFGKGIHNILEAATFGLPIIFGPNYLKFQEASQLIAEKGAFTIEHYPELKNYLDKLYTNPNYLATSGNVAKNFVQRNTGATDVIVSFADPLLSK